VNVGRRPFLAVLLVLAHVAFPAAQGLPLADPESVGMSAPRLKRLTASMQRAIDEGSIAGAVTLIARDGKIVHYQAIGMLDREKGVPMPKDAIFRIASMSKAVTSVAAMLLVEEGLMTLDDRVSRFIPAYRKTTVRDPAGGAPVPARREITIRDLLTHTAGISYGGGPLEAQYKDKNLYMWYFGDKDEPIAVSMERLASLPFEAQPGERYVYGFATDLLGAVIEKASGMSLDAFFRGRIFEPLQMHDTMFYLDATRASRLASVYTRESDRLVRAAAGGFGQGDYLAGPRTSFSGGAGLLSTASDYARFLQMLLNGGELDGVRVLSPKTIELMVSNHVGTLYQEGRLGFGLGFEITEHVGRSARPGSTGEFGWSGAYHTKFWVDPQERIVAVFMSQTQPWPGTRVFDLFRQALYQAVVRSYDRN
jgi:CubicO group peptidase (beta-lactamase class C family)